MDNDMWLVETMNTGPKGLCSPGGNSSGYCSSEDSHMIIATSSSGSLQCKVAAPVHPPVLSGVDHLLIGQEDMFTVAKTSAGISDSLWEQSSTSDANWWSSKTVVPHHHRVCHGLIAKQLTASKSPMSENGTFESELKIGQAVAVWNRHVASELGNPFSPPVDDCKYKPVKMEYSESAVDVTVSSRGQCSSKSPMVVIRPVARGRAGASLVSCSTILRRSATVPSRMPTVAGLGVTTHCHSPRPDHVYAHQPHIHGVDSPPSIHDALRDHMYAVKVPPRTSTGHNTCMSTWSKCSRSRRSQSHLDATDSPAQMSILEAFLRSTTPCFDANRGSTAIAAEELRRLHVADRYHSESADKMYIKQEPQDQTLSPSLLKQLLTSDDCELDKARDESDGGDSEASSHGMAVDSVLTDGFGLDADLCLDDPLSNGIGLLEDDDDTSNCDVTVKAEHSPAVSHPV